MILTAPELQMNPVLKKKFQAVNFLAHGSTMMLKPAVFIVTVEAKGGLKAVMVEKPIQN